MENLYTVAIEEDGGFTLPSEVLDRLQWKVGDPLEFKTDESGIVIRKADAPSESDR